MCNIMFCSHSYLYHTIILVDGEMEISYLDSKLHISPSNYSCISVTADNDDTRSPDCKIFGIDISTTCQQLRLDMILIFSDLVL